MQKYSFICDYFIYLLKYSKSTTNETPTYFITALPERAIYNVSVLRAGTFCLWCQGGLSLSAY